MSMKYQAVANALRSQITAGVFPAGSLLPTEYALCLTHQVSRQTVRRALSLLAEENLIVSRQGCGWRVVSRQHPIGDRHTNVAIVATYINDYIFPTILGEAERVFSANNCTPLLFATHNQVDQERSILRKLLTMKIDGILVEGCKSTLPNPNLDLYQIFLQQDIPLVFMHSRYRSLPQALAVLDDNYAGGKLLVEYLFGKGHRAIAGIFKSDDLQGLQRYEGYLTALRNLSLPMRDEKVYWYDTASREQLLNGDSSDALIKTLSGCTAVVCYNDEIAHRLISLLTERGIRIPQQMAVVSFDNSLYSNLSPIPITSLSHGNENVGAVAAKLLLQLMNGEQSYSQTLPWVLVEKESG